ncbi:hypothetical protein AYI68_g7549 [Smittium mucronatum]|uniref:TLC domain-containing protein n=1 Tax=Smittium mucronatum TaxID=133383 RepID=A0A1R0GND8_9FUNG|nr:hypothetical protein AYI68_g7549 [Smittium mucronatum]
MSPSNPLTPFFLGLAVGSAVLNGIFFIVRKNSSYTTEKQLAWVLTFVSCVTVTCASLPYLYLLFKNNLDVTRCISSDSFSLLTCGFFEAYLFWDLAIGLRYYRSTFDLVTGYFHHGLYILMVYYVSVIGYSAIFVLCCIMELPTIVLAVGCINKNMRKDWLFASCFFSTRLLLHVVLLYRFYSYFPDRLVWKLVASSLPLHLYWFSNFIKQQKRLYKNRKNASVVSQ